MICIISEIAEFVLHAAIVKTRTSTTPRALPCANRWDDWRAWSDLHGPAHNLANRSRGIRWRQFEEGSEGGQGRTNAAIRRVLAPAAAAG